MRTIQLDEEGYFHFGETRVTDAAQGLKLLQSLQVDDNGRFFVEVDEYLPW